MASSFPFLLRVAAGLVSDTVDVVKRIPEELPTLGVTLVGKAAKLSFELNQQLAALAVRGDHALSALSGGDEPPPERTAWSTIDDEDEVAANDPQAAARWDSADEDETDENGTYEHGTQGDETDEDRTDGDQASDAAAYLSEVTVAESEAPGFPAAASTAATGSAAAFDSSARTSSLTASEITEVGGAAAGSEPGSDPGVAGYQQLSLAQLRGKLRTMTPDQLASALSFEQTHQSRPAFLTLLTNRLATVSAR